MNSDTKRILHQFDNPDVYEAYYSQSHLRERLSQPTVVLSILVLGFAIYYQLAVQDGRAPPLPDLLWNAFVRITPARLLYAVDHWLHPPLFPIPMLKTQPRTHAAKSDVLRRILGMDKQDGIMKSVSQAGSRGLGSFSGGGYGVKRKGDSIRPPGLGNWDNSCYQNSILQGLAALKPLPDYLGGLSWDKPMSKMGAGTAETLLDLVRDLNDTANNGTTLWTPSVLKNMSTWQQQDAQEYFSKLLDEIDKEIAREAKAILKPAGFENELGSDETAGSQHSDDSGYQSLSNHSKATVDLRIMRNPLEGLTAQRVACTTCGYTEGLSMIPFNCITLSLGTDQSEHDLYEQLDSYSKVESIPGVDCAKCSLLKYRNLLSILVERTRKAGTTEEQFPEPFARLRAIEAALEDDAFDDKTLTEKCKIPPQQRVTSTKTKQVVVARPPQSLVVHMNRSVFDEMTGRMWKNLAAVKFPTTLDLGPWCLGSADGVMSLIGDAKHTAAVSEKDGAGTDLSTIVSAQDEEQWALDPTASMVAGDRHPSKITGPIYELRAVITHYGRHENGHYVCYRRHPTVSVPEQALKDVDKPPQLRNGDDADAVDSLVTADERPNSGAGRGADDPVEFAAGRDQAATTTGDEHVAAPDQTWWRLSDQDVTKVDEEIVLAQGGVFMLFYDCVDPNSVLTSELDGSLADSAVAKTAEGDKEEKEITSDVVAPAAENMSRADADSASQQEEAEVQTVVAASDIETTTMGDEKHSIAVLEKAMSTPLPLGDEDDPL